MHIPPPHCTLPFGHEGRHQTTEIPEPLSGPVASALQAHDEAQTMMGEVREMRASATRRITRHWYLLLAFFFGNVLFATVVLIGAWHVYN